MTEPTPQLDDAAAPDHGRLCRTCQAPMADDQDWCLACGHAVSGRAGRLPGMRAAGTVAALTLALSGGAVAAAYAALSDSPPPPAATQVAQAPPTTTTTAPAPTTPPVDTAPTTPPSSDGAPSTSLPALPDLSSDVPVTPTSPKSGSGGSKQQSSSGSTSTPRSQSGSGDSGGTDTTDTSTTGTTTTPAAPKRIKLDGAAVQLYDPFTRATTEGDTVALVDGKPSTSWSVSAPDGAQVMNAGVVVDLGSERGIREIDLTTTTPGFKIEIYAADADELPPTVLDTRWAHLKDVGDIGTQTDDNSQSITLGRGTSKYRYLLLWFKQPPKPGPTITLSRLKLLG